MKAKINEDSDLKILVETEEEAKLLINWVNKHRPLKVDWTKVEKIKIIEEMLNTSERLKN